jgi:hypothetical protein
MLAWCIFLFILGALAFLDTLMNYGEIFRRVNSVVFMLISLGLLVRTAMKVKIRRVEGLIAKVEELEEQLARFKGAAQNKDVKENEPVH